MAEQPEVQPGTFGDALRQALFGKRHTQTWLAEQLGTSNQQVNRWVNNRQVPHLDKVRQIEDLLGTDLNDAFRHSMRVPEPSIEHGLFVSAPAAELRNEEISAHRNDVARVVAAAKNVVDRVYWSSEEVGSILDLGAADLATETSLQALNTCRAYLYLQFADLTNPSGALVELGFALGRKLKTTMIIKKDLRTPYMFEGFQGVAARLYFLPEVRIYLVDEVDDAVRLIERDGDHLLLPD
jgi:transcriptional regulator with XRE-family HTH domain